MVVVPKVSEVKKMLSVSEAAAFCGVSRGTVGYWLRSRKIVGRRVGRAYSIPVEELLLFLKSTGQEIPAALVDNDARVPYFRALPECWDYWKCDDDEEGRNCMVQTKRLRVCFAAKQYTGTRVERQCHSCSYYLENYFPRIQFIHQIDAPAVVYKDLCFWGGNPGFAQLCEAKESDLIGMGFERVVHPDSLEAVISHAKQRALAHSVTPTTYCVHLKNSQQGRVRIDAMDCPLKEPEGAGLLIAQQVRNQ